MSNYQQNFVERIERAAEAVQEQAKSDHPAFKADCIKQVKALELMAEQFRADGGHLIGRLPRDVGLELLRALPAPQSPIKAIRAKCIDCCCFQPGEVRKCVAVKCPLWPYRMGSSPYHARSALAQNTAGLEGGFSDAAAIPAAEVL